MVHQCYLVTWYSWSHDTSPLSSHMVHHPYLVTWCIIPTWSHDTAGHMIHRPYLVTWYSIPIRSHGKTFLPGHISVSFVSHFLTAIFAVNEQMPILVFSECICHRRLCWQLPGQHGWADVILVSSLAGAIWWSGWCKVPNAMDKVMVNAVQTWQRQSVLPGHDDRCVCLCVWSVCSWLVYHSCGWAVFTYH